jgi:hypothetical protein
MMKDLPTPEQYRAACDTAVKLDTAPAHECLGDFCPSCGQPWDPPMPGGPECHCPEYLVHADLTTGWIGVATVKQIQARPRAA